MDKLRIGIIGAGTIVETNHLPAITSLPLAEIAWIYDTNPARIALVSDMYGIAGLGGRPVDEGLKEVDICFLASPYGTRKPYIEACRTLGKGLIVEKPFAFSAEEHVQHCNGFEPWKIAVIFQRRFYRQVETLAKMIRGDYFGPLRSVRYIQGHFSLKGGSGYHSSVQLAGGGIVAENASHILDLLLMVTSAKAVKLSGLQSIQREGIDFEAVFDSIFETETGTIPVHCEISRLRNLASGLFLEFEHALVSCDLTPDGKIVVHDSRGRRAAFSLTDESRIEELSARATMVNEAFHIFWEQFLLGVAEKKPNRTSAYQSLLTSSWIGEIYKKIHLV